MLLTMFVSLYTVRIVLNCLGLIDYGIYSVIGGIVTILSFLSNSMASACQRFFSFNLGRNDIFQLKKTVNTTLNIFFLISIIIFILAETIGLWIINEKINIPLERMSAAVFVYQFSVFTFIISVIVIPYNAIIIAHENMSIFAWISIIEVLLKLGFAYLLVFSPFDKLEFYSLLMFISTFIVSFIYVFYCIRQYKESKYSFSFDKKLFKIIFYYSIWNLFGSITTVLNNQGINIVLNLFFGPIVNAARAIAYQVNSALISFINNFYTAINPQIIKSYAIGNYERTFSLSFISTKIGFFLLLILALPIYIKIDTVLILWLKETNEYMITFTRLVLIFSLVNVLENPLTQVARATGYIKKYQLYVGVFTLITVPVTYFLFDNNFEPEVSFIILIIVYSFATFIRLYVLKNTINYPLDIYLKNILFRLFCVLLFSPILPYLFNYNIKNIYVEFLMLYIISTISILICFFLLGLNNVEKKYIISHVYRYIERKRLV
jgi:O-antigen/teichoic acid export membrane protein